MFSLYPSKVIITICGISLNGKRNVNMGFPRFLAKCTYLGFFRVIGFAKTELMKQDVRCNIKLLPTYTFAQPLYCKECCKFIRQCCRLQQHYVHRIFHEKQITASKVEIWVSLSLSRTHARTHTHTPWLHHHLLSSFSESKVK